MICCGVVLLQLAKSAKDVPDTEVFKGDLDQVRTVAEVEEPEYEPRADAIRGGAGIVRAMSKVRTKREADEAKRLHEERLQSINEGDQFEWDGMRRRRTISSAGGSAVGSIYRRKTIHPPLGMTHFPEDDRTSEPDSEVHPGFFGRIGRKAVNSEPGRSRSGRSPIPLSAVTPSKSDAPTETDGGHEHVFGLPAGLRKDAVDHDDTAYKGAGGDEGPRIRFTGDAASETRDRPTSRGSSVAPPAPPPHGRPSPGGRRQFSFQNPFQRRSPADHGEHASRPTSRGAHSPMSRASAREYPTGSNTTEEERLGLVHGDGSSHPTPPRYTEMPAEEDVERRSSEEWQMTSGRGSSSPEELGDLGARRRQDSYDEYAGEELYNEPLRSPISRDESSGRRGRRFM